MEQKYNATVEQVFALLTDPQWIEARCLALGESSVRIKTRKVGKGVVISMARRMKRELPALVAKVLSAQSDLQFEETWTRDGDGYTGTLAMDIVGKPVTMSAPFSLRPSGKGCTYSIEHQTKCSIPLVGGAVARFAQGQAEQTCAAEFTYLVKHLKSAR